MSEKEPTPNKDCGTAFSSDIPRKVTKPKLFDEAMHVRLPAGTKARIDAQRGDIRQGDFVRQILLASLDDLEKAGDGAKSSKG